MLGALIGALIGAAISGITAVVQSNQMDEAAKRQEEMAKKNFAQTSRQKISQTLSAAARSTAGLAIDKSIAEGNEKRINKGLHEGYTRVADTNKDQDRVASARDVRRAYNYGSRTA